MSKYRATVNVDLDGVLYPWSEQFASYVGAIRGGKGIFWWYYSGVEKPYPEPTTWNFWPEWDLTEDDFKMLFRNAVRDGVVWGEGKPLPGAQWLMGQLSSNDYLVRIVTTRLTNDHTFASVQRLTSDWLDQYAIPYREIAYIGDGGTKADYRADFAIDDSPTNVEEMRAVGIRAHLLARTWNQSSDLGFVITLREFYGAIEKATSRGQTSSVAAGRPDDDEPQPWAYGEDKALPSGPLDSSTSTGVRWSDSVVRPSARRVEILSDGEVVLRPTYDD